jgi:hypothetical protein
MYRTWKEALLFVIVVFLFVCVLFVLSALKADAYTESQIKLLKMAYEEGKNLPKHPEILQIILLNESLAGKVGRHGDKKFKSWRMHAYGVMQVQFRTAKLVVKNQTSLKFPNDWALRNKLKNDDAFNIHIARLYVAWLMKLNKGNYFKTILSYNTGPGSVKKHGFSWDPNKYVAKAKRNLHEMVKFNLKHDIADGTVITHTIKRGDTLARIAKLYLNCQKRWKEIHAVNPKVNPKRLEVGATLYVKL